MTTQKKHHDKRKLGLAVLAGLAITGLVGASAATLGGISNEGLGADADDVVSCDTNGVSVGYDTTYAGLNTVGVDEVIISQVHMNCAALSFEVQLYDGLDAVIIEKSGTVVLTPSVDPTTGLQIDPIESNEFSIDFSGDNVDAEVVEGIAITITGNELEDAAP